MGQLLAYLPGYAGKDKAKLVEVGLGSLLDASVDPIFSACAKGPDGGSGSLVTFCGFVPDAPRSFDAELQQWQAAARDGDLAAGRYWLGYVKADKPTAGDLQRAILIESEPVTLEDGNRWMVPCCEYAPRRLTRDRDTGAEVRKVKDEHARWVEWSNEIFEKIIEHDYAALARSGYVVRIANGMQYAALTLSKNYRVNTDVCDLLNLLDENQVAEIILVATGVMLRARLLTEAKKKTGRSHPAT